MNDTRPGQVIRDALMRGCDFGHHDESLRALRDDALAALDALEQQLANAEGGAEWQYGMGKRWRDRALAAEERAEELAAQLAGMTNVWLAVCEEKKIAEERAEQLAAALNEEHEYQCGCIEPGDPMVCNMGAHFSVLAGRETRETSGT
jgi:hypothetical protein